MRALSQKGHAVGLGEAARHQRPGERVVDFAAALRDEMFAVQSEVVVAGDDEFELGGDFSQHPDGACKAGSVAIFCQVAAVENHVHVWCWEAESRGRVFGQFEVVSVGENQESYARPAVGLVFIFGFVVVVS